MIYALNAEGLSYEDEANGVLEFADEAAAEDAFRAYRELHRNSRPYDSSGDRFGGGPPVAATLDHAMARALAADLLAFADSTEATEGT